MFRWLAAVMLSSFVLVHLPALTAAEAIKSPQLAMQDQFAKPHDLSALRGDVAVLVFADRGGAEASRDLGVKLHVHFHPTAKGQPVAKSAVAPARAIPNLPRGAKAPDAKMIAIAVIGEVPSALHGMIRMRFRQVAPEAPIWLDFTDAMRQQFTVTPDVPNVAVLDVQGRLRYSAAGKFDQRQFDELALIIEALRREAVID
jgi:hypothetical protein